MLLYTKYYRGKRRTCSGQGQCPANSHQEQQGKDTNELSLVGLKSQYMCMVAVCMRKNAIVWRSDFATHDH